MTPATPVAARPPARSRFTLAWRIFLGTAAVVAIVLAATLAVASYVAGRNADTAVQAGLEQTNALIVSMLQQQRASMLGMATLFSENPAFRAQVHPMTADTTDRTMLDQSQTAANLLGVTWVQIFDADGVRLAKSDDSTAKPIDLSGSLLVSTPLESGAHSEGFVVNDTTKLLQAVSVPINGAGGARLGVMMAGQLVNDSLALVIGKQTGTQLVFYTIPRNMGPQLSVIPKELGERRELEGAVHSAMTATSASDSAHGAMDAHHMMMAMGDRKEVLIAGHTYVGQREALLGADESEVGGFIALRDKDRELAGYYELRKWMLVSGAGGLLLAFLLSFVLSQHIVRPLRGLAAATQRAAQGDYAAEIPVAGGDEIGVLAGAFRQLLADLREKQSLVDFLQTSDSAERTVQVRAPSATPMQIQAMAGAMLEPGQTLAARYDIKGVLGVGGMGMVYKAQDRELGEPVAIKTLKPDMVKQDPAALDRFKSEIRLARKIAHRNVVRTYDLGESGGVYFITMELVEGKSLKELILSRGRLPASVTLPIAKQLCRALEVAHEEGVIHRDIKPQNMVVGPDGVLKVMDFGIARLAQRAPEAGHTRAGMVVGTPEYMAPEQLLGQEIDGRADLYSAGVVIYECLTGRLPHIADTPITLISKVLNERPAPPRDVQADIPAPLSDIVLRTLARDPDKRPKTAAVLHDWLDAL